MKHHGIIFDCDGTLVDSLSQALESFNYALVKVGSNARTPAEIKRYFGAAADRILLSLLNDEDLALKAFEIYLDHQTELAKNTKLHHGVRELLDKLAEEKVPMAIVTGRHERDLEIVLKPHKISDYFVALVTDNHIPHSKPAPDGILLAAKKMGIPASQSFYVGDSTVDMLAAHNAGSIPVAALWDVLAKPPEMIAEKPKYVAQSPSDVWSFYKTHFDLNKER